MIKHAVGEKVRPGHHNEWNLKNILRYVIRQALSFQDPHLRVALLARPSMISFKTEVWLYIALHHSTTVSYLYVTCDRLLTIAGLTLTS